MSTAFRLGAVAVAVLGVALWNGPVSRVLAAEGAAAPASSADYKIGIVNMDEVIKGYNKLKAESDALQKEKDTLQSSLDAKTDALQKKMEEAKNAPEADRDRLRDSVESEIRNLRAELQKMQGELDSKGAKLRARTREDIIKAIREVGALEDYHLILEADADGRSTVIYSTATINITSKIVTKLNGSAPAAAVPAASGKKTGQ